MLCDEITVLETESATLREKNEALDGWLTHADELLHQAEEKLERVREAFKANQYIGEYTKLERAIDAALAEEGE